MPTEKSLDYLVSIVGIKLNYKLGSETEADSEIQPMFQSPAPIAPPPCVFALFYEVKTVNTVKVLYVQRCKGQMISYGCCSNKKVSYFNLFTFAF